jgi:hypothetical protein
LLPSAPAAGESKGAQSFREGTRASPAGVRISFGGIRGHAESCARADERAEERHALYGVADAQAAGLARNEERQEAYDAEGPTAAVVSEVHRRSPQFWQPRFYDFNVYSHEKKKEKLEYMHANPVVRGLVKHPKDWPWSSFSFYAKDEKGLVEIDAVDI